MGLGREEGRGPGEPAGRHAGWLSCEAGRQAGASPSDACYVHPDQQLRQARGIGHRCVDGQQEAGGQELERPGQRPRLDAQLQSGDGAAGGAAARGAVGLHHRAVRQVGA